MQYSQEHLKTMVYAEFGGQTECIMGNSKIENLFGMQLLKTSIINEIFYGIHINTFGGGSYPGSSQSDFFLVHR